jgi:demethylmenaquinone methyltransferase/2-methoxy-6-polyprenyl-1,4-benzoquinol methylase
MAIELCNFWKGKASIEGIDFSRELLEVARRKVTKANLNHRITFREGNAESLPCEDEQFDAVTITFGLRNISDRMKALKEFHRVAKPGGLFICLEFSQPANPFFLKIYSLYLMHFTPLVAKCLGSDPAAYRYLGKTIQEFPSPQGLSHLIASTGWKDIIYKKLANGIVALHRGMKR